MKTSRNAGRRPSPASGFSLLEMLIAAVILTIGLIGVLSVFGVAMATTHSSQQDLLAKQLASEALENVFTARNSSELTWLQIQNIGSGTVPDGVFVTGFQTIKQAGVDGILGTADDALAAPKVMTLAGPDGVLGTADDQVVPLTNFQRSILIQPVPGTDALRTLTVTVRYVVPPLRSTRTYTITGYISQYR
ncbi:MAG TPA: prepilin-type N-terminal cleavage/methylation domain-containing protein [Candidatus Saccharimonadales bacterium]|jgi:prepilin-type N-terminal cleavage/methylation domain-containing protein|nr:prepilin-type N-terminal cleavage/methylation domain-containing protein [Candidatus Saccharimonadales bacterium]